MRIPPQLARFGAFAALTASLLAGGTAVAHAQPAPAQAAFAQPAAAQSAAVQPAAVGSICHSKLPAQAHDTLRLIEKGGPYPYPQDGTVFQNREGILPQQNRGYYHEYTVRTPGSENRGARRIVTGDRQQEDYYTSDHYRSFDRVDHRC